MASEPLALQKRLPPFILIACALLSAAAYVWALDRGPVYLGFDEAHFGVQGHAIAQNGRNLSGMRLPLFVNLYDPAGDQQLSDLHTRWYQPLLFYILALELRFVPLNEVTLRLPTALIAGLVIPLLTFIVARRLFRSVALAALAALFIATSPTMFILGRQALDYVLPVPFVLGWMWTLLLYGEHGRLRDAVIAGLLLGIGFYSYIASWVFMPMCLVLSLIVLWRSGHAGSRRASVAMAVAFTVPLLPLLPWFITHPEMLRDTLTRYQPIAVAGMGNTGGEWYQVVDPAVWWQRAVTYVSFFDPRMLFVRGGPVTTTSLGRSGALVLPAAVLIPAGLYVLLTDRRFRDAAPLVLGGLLLAPIPAIFANEMGMIQRVLPLLVFLSFVAAAGASLLWRLQPLVQRALVAALVFSCVAQFGYVYYDFFGHYQFRSAFYYDAAVLGSVADDLVTDRDLPAVYLSRDLDDPSSRWRFFTIKHNRGDLLGKTHYIDPGEAARLDAPPGSVFVTLPHEPVLKALRDSGVWRVRKEIDDADNRPASVILERIAR